MEKRSHHAMHGGKRIDAYAYDTAELTLITDSHDPLYDKRVEDPLTREFLLNIAARGVETAISVRKRAPDTIVVRGKQRTKSVTVINALACGIPYTGSVKAIHTAIRNFGADVDFVKKVTMFVKKPLKLRALPANSGDERDARMSMRAENAHRHGDALLDRVRFVQEEHEKYGTSVEELAANENVSEASVKRWLKMDTSKPRTKKKRGKASRPARAQIANLAEQVKVHMTERERALVDWILGRSNGVDVAELFLGTHKTRREAATDMARDARGT